MTAQRKRILFVLPSLEGGGAQRVIVMLLRHLDRARFEPHLALLSKSGPYLREVADDVPLHGLQVSRVRYSIPALVRLIRKLRPAVAVSTFYELNLAMAMARPVLPREMRLLLREDISPGAQIDQESRYPGLWRWLYRRFYPKADTVICVADYIVRDLAENFGVPRQNLVRIYNPVEVERVRRLAESLDNPYAGGGPQLVTVARLGKQKGIDRLLDALPLVREKIPAIQLTLVGEGPLEVELKEHSERLGLAQAVRFVGFQSNPYPYVKYADLFVLSSRFEGLPLVVLEALALGKRVVAMDCPGGVRELLAGSPLGRLVPDSDVRQLAEAIIAACSRPGQAESGTASVEALLKTFGIEEVIRQYEDLLSA